MNIKKHRIKMINIICAVTILFAAVNIAFDYNLQNTAKQMYEHPYTVTNTSRAMRSRLLDMKQFIKLILTYDFTSEDQIMDLLNTRYDTQNKAISELYDRYLGPIEDIDALKNSFDEMVACQGQAVQFADEHTIKETEAYIEKNLHPCYDKVNNCLKTIIEFSDDKIASLTQESQRTSLFSMGITLFMSITLIVLTIYSNRSHHKNIAMLKKREHDLQDALAMAQQANRAKKDFLSRMSHEIRTPLNVIIGMTTIIAAHLDDRERTEDCLAKISYSSRHLLSLINDVLDMSKIEEGKLMINYEPFQMQELLESVVALIYSQVKEQGKNFECVVRDEVYETYIGDSLRINQILLNLLSNAVKFTPKDGTIRLEICQTTKKNGRAYLRFVVSDTGIGMSEEFLQRIFQPFEQNDSSTSTKYGGTGLGMAITYNLVGLLGGSIDVKSKLEEGSVFTVELPLDIPKNLVSPQKEHLDSLKVLVVDDDEVSCVHAALLLEKMGLETKWLQSGEEAITTLLTAHNEGQDYDVCFIDWRMPEMNGLEVTRRIRKTLGPDVLIIIITAYDWSQIELEARQAGANGFVAKPLFASSLYNALQTVKSGTPLSMNSEWLNETGEGVCNGKRILLVEDNELNQEIAVELLRFTGAEIECAGNGKEAVDRFLASEEHYYDLILMDVQMPIMDGYEATRCLRASNRSDAETVPIFAMTANAFKEDVKDAYDSGMNGHLAKPIEVGVLYTMLKNLFSPK